ncbi:4Fe-4S binding protein [Maridesulfovibrio sp. FT414]|uniref:4Fe-4S binding protein n=1 Tax=Maridesulfovibrio sp. FT414 TaxID=2979469 RepID=UPI003D8063BE
MTCSRLQLICFSPTRTTRKVLSAIAEGVGAEETRMIDVTRADDFPVCYGCDDSDLVIIGAPVYAGRLPITAVERFAGLRSSGRPAVLVVTYGNRAYEDALLELRDLAVEAGFKPVAAAAFVGEHSFSSEETPVAVGRPDVSDRDAAGKFGQSIRQLLSAGDPDGLPEIEVPGNRPYKERVARPPASPVSKDGCELCGACERVCPTGAISVGSLVDTDAAQCILCCACVKVCASGDRIMDVPRVMEVARWLAETCEERKEPEIFI